MVSVGEGGTGSRNVSLEIRQCLCTFMAMLNVTMITMAWELHRQGVPKAHIAQRWAGTARPSTFGYAG